jgi:hypothetical protein
MSSLSAAEVLAAAQAELAAAAGVPVSAVSEETVQAMLAALEAEEAEEAEAQGQPRASGSAASPAGTAAGSAPATPPPPAAPGECGGGGDGSEAAAADDGASDLSLERVIIKSSAGPEPFPGIPQLPPRMPAEAGQVLVRFDLEEVSGSRGGARPPRPGSGPARRRMQARGLLTCRTMQLLRHAGSVTPPPSAAHAARFAQPQPQ